MSNINYDVLYPVEYDDRYKHYLARYQVRLIPYKNTIVAESWGHWTIYDSTYEAAVSFDDGNEISINGQRRYEIGFGDNSYLWLTVPVQESGPFKRVYIRNPHPESVRFTNSHIKFNIEYLIKAEFEIQFNSIGFAANRNASFRCSTVQKNTIAQYEWDSAVVYYKKSTEETYNSVNGVVSGNWADVKISTNVGFEDGYTYDVYIVATADDGTTAQTPIAQFTTTDAPAIATPIYPVGAFISGEVTFSWSHSTEYGTPQYAYDLRYSANNGGSWVNVVNHAITTASSYTATIEAAGSYIWQIRTYNTNDVPGEWVQAAFVNSVPATPPQNVRVTTEGRPTVSWIVASQSAYQVQALIGDSVEYDSGAIYSAQTSHIINQYLYDDKTYTIRVRVYNALGEISDWTSTGYQQPNISDVEFRVEQDPNGGADVIITDNDVFDKYYILRDGKTIATITSGTYYDRFAIGDVTYSVVGVTSNDNSDIKSSGLKTVYPKATIVTLAGEIHTVNRRFNESYSVETVSQIRYNKAEYIGATRPDYYADKMVTKTFSIACYDENDRLENLLGKIVFYADNFGNGGYCFVSGYSKKDDYLQLPNNKYANETILTLEVTDYDDSIKYEL